MRATLVAFIATLLLLQRTQARPALALRQSDLDPGLSPEPSIDPDITESPSPDAAGFVGQSSSSANTVGIVLASVTLAVALLAGLGLAFGLSTPSGATVATYAAATGSSAPQQPTTTEL